MGDTSDEKKSSKWASMNMRQKYHYLISNITVEPIFICYVIPSVLTSLTVQNLNLDKACRVNLAYGEQVCAALIAQNVQNYTIEEKEVQRIVVDMDSWKSVLLHALPSALILFIGSWSDRRGRRKPFLILPLIGELLSSVGLIFCTYFFLETPMEVAGVVEGLFPALTGGWMTMFMGCFSYVADVTTDESRTFRIGIVTIMLSVCVPISAPLSGILHKQIGYYGMFSLSSVLYICGLTYGILRIKEPKPSVPRPEGISFFKDFFDLKLVVETFSVAFKKRKGSRRTNVILLMILSFIIVGPIFGETARTYIFLRYQFKWDEVKYSLYGTYGTITGLVGTTIVTVLFCRVLQLNDNIIGLIGTLSKIVASFIYAFSTTELMFYIAPLIEILSTGGMLALRSLSSKIVDPTELGKMNSLLGVCEGVAPLLYGPLYSKFYNWTSERLPGAFFLLSAALTTIAAVLFATMYYLQKLDSKVANTNQDAEDHGTFKYNLPSHEHFHVNDGFDDNSVYTSKV